MSFLPGCFPAIFAAAEAAAVTSLAVQSSNTSSAQTITGPADIAAGDLLVLYDMAVDSPAPSAVVPTDFTIVTNVSDSILRGIISYKIADGSEASASLTGMNGATQNRKALYVFRGDVAINTVSPQSVNQPAPTGGDPTAQSVTAGSGAVPLVVIAGYGSSGIIDPRTFSTTKDGEINPNTNMYLAYKIYNSSPANTTIDMADEGVSNNLHSFYLEVA